MVKKKILFIAHSFGLGGAQNILKSLVLGLSKNYEIVIFGPNESHNFSGFQVYNQGKFLALPIRPNPLGYLRFINNFSSNLNKISQIIKKENPDLIISNTVTVPHGWLAAKLNHKPLAWIVHEILVKPAFVKSLLRRMVKSSDKIICVSSATKSSWRLEKAEVIYNPLLLEPGKLISKDKSGNKFVIGKIGEVTWIKGDDNFARIAKNFIGQKNIEFHIFGNVNEQGRFVKKLKSKIKKEAITNLVFRGTLPLQNIFQEIDLLLITSRSESFSLVLLDAIAAKIPVVAFDVGGIREIAEQAEGVELIERDNTKAMIFKVEQIIAGEKQLIVKSNNDFLQTFSLSNFERKYNQTIQKLI